MPKPCSQLGFRPMQQATGCPTAVTRLGNGASDVAVLTQGEFANRDQNMGIFILPYLAGDVAYAEKLQGFSGRVKNVEGSFFGASRDACYTGWRSTAEKEVQAPR